MSVTQKQDLIVTIHKPDKDRYYLKNWRPITLLTVYYKIASAVIAESLKKFFLRSLVDHKKATRKGNLFEKTPGFYII